MRILASVDGSAASLLAARYAAEIAAATNGSLVLAYAVPLGTQTTAAAAESNPVLRAGREAVSPFRASVSIQLVAGAPADAIVRLIRAHPFELVAMGSRGLGESGARGLFLGSTALRVVRDVRAPVLLVRATERGEPVGRSQPPHISSLLVPTDGSLASLEAADLGARLADALAAQASLLYVGSPATAGDPKLAAEILEVSRRPFDRLSCSVRALSAQSADVGGAILDTARTGGYDLLLMGTYGAGEAWHRQLHVGSVAERVLIGAPCPVVLVKHPADEAMVRR